MLKSIIVVLATTALGGCASHLRVYADEAGTKHVAGVPIHSPEIYVKLGRFMKLAKGGSCDPTDFVETVMLPSGPAYYVNVDSAQFAKTEFAVKFSDAGNVSEVTMNTEPSSGDALKNAAELVKAITPMMGMGANAAPFVGPIQPCDAGADVASIKFVRFADWQAHR